MCRWRDYLPLLSSHWSCSCDCWAGVRLCRLVQLVWKGNRYSQAVGRSDDLHAEAMSRAMKQRIAALTLVVVLIAVALLNLLSLVGVSSISDAALKSLTLPALIVIPVYLAARAHGDGGTRS